MELTRHMGHTKASVAVAGDTVSLSHCDSLSNLYNEIEALADKRKQSANILGDKAILDALTQTVETIFLHISTGGKIMIAGNGGSASQSQHLCAELMGRYKKSRYPIQAISLSSDLSLMTCIANDFGYERIFSRQIEGLGNADDVFIAFTTSGKSRNIIEALCECKSRNITSMVFTGNETDSIKRLANIVVSVPIDDTAIIQEVHMQLIHMLCEAIECRLCEGDTIWNRVLELGRQGYSCLILDRDGVINHVKANGYIALPKEFIFREDFLNHIKELSDTFKYIFVVSNQKGVGKGQMSLDELQNVHDSMNAEILQSGGRIDKIYVSTSANNDSPENKPNTGMADMIKKDYPAIDFSKTIVVGDSASDYLFADKLKCRFVYDRTR